MLRLLWLSALVVALDQVSKFWILAVFDDYQVVEILPVFNLTLVYNTGAAFSFLSDAGGWQRWFFITVAAVVTVVMTVWLAGLRSHERLTGVGLALVVGGAVGNLIDRVWLGKVIDFLQLYWQQWYWPAFNLADSAITVGVVLLLFDAFRGQEPQREPGSSD
jgi:signal peptidase II